MISFMPAADCDRLRRLWELPAAADSNDLLWGFSLCGYSDESREVDKKNNLRRMARSECWSIFIPNETTPDLAQALLKSIDADMQELLELC